MLGNILLAGGGSQLKWLDRMIEDSLQEYGEGTVRKVYDSVFVSALRLAMEMPPQYWNKLKDMDNDKMAA